MHGNRRYLPLALLLAFVLGNRAQCEQRAGSEAYDPVALRVPGNACVELVDPGGRGWSDLASATLLDTLESLWLRIERRASGNRVFVCASDAVPLRLGYEVGIDIVRTGGATGRSALSLDTGDAVEVSAWADPDSVAEGGPVQLHLDVSGGTPPYTYRWVGAVSDDTLAAPSATGPGRYYVWAFDSDAAGMTVPLHYDWTVVDVAAILPDTHATATPDTINPGQKARLGVTPAPMSAHWSPIADLDNPYTVSPLASPVNTTDYSATAIFNGPSYLGVRLTIRIVLDATANPPSITPGAYSLVRATVLAGGHPAVYSYTYVWSPADGIRNGVFGLSRSVSPKKTTTYTVIAIDPFGQMAMDTVTVEVKP
jgi:hypothetical protein